MSGEDIEIKNKMEFDIEEYKEWFLDGKYIWNSKVKFNKQNCSL